MEAGEQQICEVDVWPYDQEPGLDITFQSSVQELLGSKTKSQQLLYTRLCLSSLSQLKRQINSKGKKKAISVKKDTRENLNVWLLKMHRK